MRVAAAAAASLVSRLFTTSASASGLANVQVRVRASIE